MNEPESKAAVSAPASEPAPEPSHVPEARPVRPAGSLSLALALLALGVSVGLAATAYFTWNQVQQLVGGQSRAETLVADRMQPLRASLGDVREALQAQNREIDRKLEAMAEQQRNLAE